MDQRRWRSGYVPGSDRRDLDAGHGGAGLRLPDEQRGGRRFRPVLTSRATPGLHVRQPDEGVVRPVPVAPARRLRLRLRLRQRSDWPELRRVAHESDIPTPRPAELPSNPIPADRPFHSLVVPRHRLHGAATGHAAAFHVHRPRAAEHASGCKLRRRPGCEEPVPLSGVRRRGTAPSSTSSRLDPPARHPTRRLFQIPDDYPGTTPGNYSNANETGDPYLNNRQPTAVTRTPRPARCPHSTWAGQLSTRITAWPTFSGPGQHTGIGVTEPLPWRRYWCQRHRGDRRPPAPLLPHARCCRRP